MTAVSAPTSIRATPWHVWFVGVLSLLWNAFGAFDYTMSHMRGDAYFRQMGMSEAKIAQFHAMPVWMELFWAVGVWGAVIGSVLLLARSRWAVPVLAASLVGAAVNMLYAAVASGGVDVITVVILVIAGLLALYARAMRRRGALA